MAEEYFDNFENEALIYIDNKLRAIRLYVEGAIRIKKLALALESEPYKIGETNSSINYHAIIPIGESYTTKTIRILH